MSSEGQATQLDTDGDGRLWFESPLWIVPSWLLSLVLHACLFLTLVSTMKSCGDGSPAATGGEFREVGIYVKQPTQTPSPLQTTPTPEEPAASPSEATAADAHAQGVDSPPRDALLLPSQALPAIGPGLSALSAPPRDLGDVVLPSSIARPPTAGGLGPGETSFFGIREKGQRFVYVVDRSGSMSANDAIAFAKAELLASLESLTDAQQFQVIFYNEAPLLMTLKSQSKGDLYRATDINRTLAKQFVIGVDVAGGTDHMPALRKALSLSPDVLYFLTDAGVPILRAGDLDELRRLNKGKSRIHCIEFGRGPELNLDGSLRTLARQNGGTYRYRDITRFKDRASTAAP